MKIKKQFRLYDVYRNIVSRKSDKIQGIAYYEVIKTGVGFECHVTYDDWITVPYYASDEDELKKQITEINKRLNTCKKPGRKGDKHVTQ